MNNKKEPLIIDVRDAKEFEKGHAKGSINIPIAQLEDRIEEIRKQGRSIITVCGGGTRNGRACTLLQQHNIDTTAGGSWKKY
ncbi:MAG: rhodanese-like domain-containing protein [Chitinophagaceae bacterium]|nr:rhodanese-like domain-containing protein [Chitinophagaceae bacterium]